MQSDTTVSGWPFVKSIQKKSWSKVPWSESAAWLLWPEVTGFKAKRTRSPQAWISSGSRRALRNFPGWKGNNSYLCLVHLYPFNIPYRPPGSLCWGRNAGGSLISICPWSGVPHSLVLTAASGSYADVVRWVRAFCCSHLLPLVLAGREQTY